MKHLHIKTNKYIERSDVDSFIANIIWVCRKHGMTLSHVDTQGAFVIEGSNEKNIIWLKDAYIGHDFKE